MSLPRTFIGFSGADIEHYWRMLGWKANEHIDFDFADFQLERKVNSESESYIKERIRPKIRYSDVYALLIGQDTWSKETFVKWEVEVAIEKGCRLVGINLNHSTVPDEWCPWFFRNVSAVFVSYSPHIIHHALSTFDPQAIGPDTWYYYPPEVYRQLGYGFEGNRALWVPAPKPWLR